MKSILILIVAILPVYLIGLYVYKQDRDKESKKLLTKLFIFGILSCFPAIILELIIGSFFGNEENMNMLMLFIYIFISIALVEEFCKWFMTYKIAYNHKEFNHIYDAIVYCVFVSLGFAVFENILYVSDVGIIIGLVRAVSAIPGHACDAIVMGHYLGMSKISKINNDKKKVRKYLILSVLVPAFIHGIYDYCLFIEETIFIFIFLIVLILIYVYGLKKIENVSEVRENFIDDNNNSINNNMIYCPRCNMQVSEKICPNCGINLVISNDNDLTH